MTTTTDQPFAGDRVVVRYRLADGAPGDWRGSGEHGLSDVTGIVDARSTPDALILTRVAPAAAASEDAVTIPVDLVTSVRPLSYRAVRNSEIRDVAARAVDAAETAELLGWRLRAGGSPAAALPAALGARLDEPAVDAIRAWYAAHDLPAIIELPERLVPGADAGRPLGGEYHRLVRLLPDGTEGDIVTVAAADRDRGAALRAEGFALHHRVTYRDLGD